MRWIYAAALLVLATSAQALTLTPTADYRAVYATVYNCTPFGCTPFNPVALPAAPYAAFDLDPSATPPYGSQHSSISPLGMHAAGSGSLSLPPRGPTDPFMGPNTVGSIFQIQFALDEAAFVSLDGSLAFDTAFGAASTTNEARVRVSLCRDRCELGDFLFDDAIATNGDPTSGSRSIDVTRVVPSGSYELIVHGVGTLAPPAFGSFSFSYQADLSIAPVPEPGVASNAAVATLGVLLAWLLRRE